MYAVKGVDPGSGDPVTVEMGYDADTGFYFGVDSMSKLDLVTGVEIRSVADLVERTRGYITWTRQLYQALRDAPVRDFAERHPHDPTTKILQAVL